MRTSAYLRLLPLVVVGLVLGCLFSSDTEGLKCEQTSHCQSGQMCVDSKCVKGTTTSDGSAGSESESDGSGSSGTGSSG